MRIAVDSGPLTSGHSVRGIGTYTRELVSAMKKTPGGVKIEPVDFSAIDFSENSGKFDVFHFTSFKPFENVLPFLKTQGTKFVLTIYDLIPLVYPKHYPPGVRGWVRWQLNKFLIRKNVDAVITISETSKKDICRFIGVKPEKVFVTRLAPSGEFEPITNYRTLAGVQKKFNLPKAFALYVGDVNYNKNIPNLIKACKIAGIPLVIAGKQALDIEDLGINLKILRGPMDYLRYLLGKPHPELAHHKELLGEFLKNKKILRLGFVKTRELVGIYNLASVVVQPSFYEGFGLPLLEAAACRAPIAAAKNQCHVEVLGSDFEYFDPKNPKDMARAIIHPNKDKNLPRVYSWATTARETLSIYEQI